MKLIELQRKKSELDSQIELFKNISDQLESLDLDNPGPALNIKGEQPSLPNQRYENKLPWKTIINTVIKPIPDKPVNTNITVDVADYPWFHGVLPRDDTPLLLKAIGDFLVRVCVK